MRFFLDSPLFDRREILEKPEIIPATRGVYAWFFRSLPPGVPTDGCFDRNGSKLLYVGISPKDDRSKQTLRRRIVYHLRGNAEGSTLRLTLGVLLTSVSGFPLRRVGSGRRLTFTHAGEQWLDAWMDANAAVCWVSDPQPWQLERALLGTASLPLNIQHNRQHPFCSHLTQMRQQAKADAKAQPIADEGNQQRR
jgi:hypothetical protein